MSRLSNIIVKHSKLLISTTLHKHGTESQCDGGEDNHGEECDCDHSGKFFIVSTFVFSHCKDRPYSLTLQVFFSLFASDIATPSAYNDKYWEYFLFLSRRTTFCSFFCKVLYFKTKWSVYERRRSIYLRVLCVGERRCAIFCRIMCVYER